MEEELAKGVKIYFVVEDNKSRWIAAEHGRGEDSAIQSQSALPLNDTR